MVLNLFVDGVRKQVPANSDNFEELLRAVAEEQFSIGRVIKEVKKDGTIYSEVYDHQAAETNLTEVNTVEIETQTAEAFAREFMRSVHHFIEKLKQGFSLAADLLSNHETVEDGFDTLAASFDAMINLRGHIEAASRILHGPQPVSTRELAMWNEFERLADSIIDSQQLGEPDVTARILRDHIPSVLDEWRNIRSSALSA